jgi:fumarate reductase flavoprotein subunit
MHNYLKRILTLVLATALIVSFVACNTVNTKSATSTASSQGFKPGTYTATTEGHGGTMTVQVTFSEKAIVSVKVQQQTETAGLGDQALQKIADEIVQGQTLAVDAVSGATDSSEALLSAVADCVRQAGGDPAALQEKKSTVSAEKVERLSADVVVVGAGASGVSAAVAAADEGAKVILLEKTDIIGGASNLSWAANFYNASVALEKGIKGDLNKTVADWIAANHWRVDAAAVRQYFSESGATYDWLAKRGYTTTFFVMGNSPLYLLPPYETRQDLLKNMLANSVEKRGGQVITRANAQKLLTDKNGNVTGVVAVRPDGSSLEVSAKAVIIATGGYAGNAEMVKQYSGFQGPLGGLSQNVGDGLKMAWAVGAEVPRNIGIQMVHQTLTNATPKLKKQFSPFEASYPLMLCYLPNFMNVGPNGARFRDESAVLAADPAAITSVYNGTYHLVIVSKSQLEMLESKGMSVLNIPRLPAMPPEFYADYKAQFTLENPWKGAEKVLEAMVANGDGYKGNTPAELAKNAGIDVETFTQEFKNYEEAAKTGVDGDFGKDSKYLLPMGKGPYYAIVAVVNNLGSVGGLTVNKKFQVLNQQRVPIKGLYAVGLEAEGTLFSDAYTGMGDGLGYAFTSGRLGGTYAAQAVLKK